MNKLTEYKKLYLIFIADTNSPTGERMYSYFCLSEYEAKGKFLTHFENLTVKDILRIELY